MCVMRLLLPVLIATGLWGQGSPLPYTKIQYFSNNGQPLAGGQLCSYLTGTTTPAATFTDYTLSVQNPLCVPLDSSGRAAIWIGATVYRIVLKDSTGVTIWTQDGIAAAGGAQPFYNATNTAGPAYEVQGTIVIDAGRNATFATLTCTSTPCGSGGGGGGSGTPAGSATNVQFNAGGTPAAFGASPNFTFNSMSQLLTVTGLSAATAGIAVANSFIQADGGFLATSGVANAFNEFQAPTGGMEALSFTAAKYVQTGHGTGPPAVTTSDTFHAGALYWDDGSHAEQVFNGSAWVSLGGGSGTPGGSNTQVQFNSSGSFAGSANLTFASNQLTVAGDVDVTVGFVSHGTATNTIQAPNGGVSGLYLIALDSLFLTEEARPALSGLGQARIYADSGAHNIQISQNGGAYAPLGGGGSGSPAGSNTQLQYNSSGAFGASPNLTFASNQLTVTGQISTSIGLFTTNIAANAIQAPSGGVLGSFLTATDSLFLIEETQPSLSGLGQARLYADSASHTLRLSQNGGAYGPLSGGGSGSAGANTQVQYSTGGGGFGASSNFTFGSQLLTVTAIDAAHAGMAVATGYMQADAGFLATSGVATAYNAFYAPTAGMAGKSFTAANYVQTGTYSAALATGPTATASDTFHAGSLSWSTVGNCEAVFNGSTWACITGGASGITSINSQAGPAINIFGTANEVIVNAATNAITLSTPQPIATTSTVTFGSVTTGAGGVVQSGATGSSIAFQNTNFNFQVDGNGNLSTQKVIINGTNGSSLSNGNLIINESTTAGGNISMKHQGTLDATWQAGSSAAFDVVDSASNHRMVILQGGEVLIGRTSDDGTLSKLEISDTGSSRGVNVSVANAVAGAFSNNSGSNATLNVVNSSSGVGILLTSSGLGVQDISTGGSAFSRITSNGTNSNSIGNGNIIINESTTLGAAISMKHQNTQDANWQAGSSAAFDIVDNTTTHRFIVLQGGTVLVGRTSTDGTGALFEVNGTVSATALNINGNPGFTGTFTCGAGQHFNSLTIASGIITNLSCN